MFKPILLAVFLVASYQPCDAMHNVQPLHSDEECLVAMSDRGKLTELFSGLDHYLKTTEMIDLLADEKFTPIQLEEVRNEILSGFLSRSKAEKPPQCPSLVWRWCLDQIAMKIDDVFDNILANFHFAKERVYAYREELERKKLEAKDQIVWAAIKKLQNHDEENKKERH
ncbi:MAG: hypothetical protein WCW33_05165 [Candidatus Babeliales bacterium]